MIGSSDDFKTGAKERAALINSFAQKYELAGVSKVDHLGYKCESSDVFEQMRRFLEHENFLYQSIVGGRRIAIIGLTIPIQTSLDDINFIELSDQKPDGSQKNGFDHAEIYPVGISYEELIAHCESKGAGFKKKERPHHTTYDAPAGEGFSMRLCEEPLIEKIKREEMN